MKDVKTIEQELVAEFVSRNDSVTFLGIGGVLRGFFTAVALKMRELYYDFNQLKRKLFIDTCSGSDLDVRVNEIGITRNTANPAGVLLLAKGTDGTTIPTDTTVTDPTSGKTYKTKQQITLGSKNNDFVYDGEINIDSINIGDIVWAECLSAGRTGNTSSDSITQISVAGVSAISNPAPAQGGKDIEGDDELRYRAKNYIKILNRNTQGFYETICQYLDERVLRVLPQKDYSIPDGIILTIVTKSGAPLTASELISLASQIYDYQKGFSTITCKNIAFTLISVSERVKLKEYNGQAVNNDLYFVETADALANYFDWSKWDFGGDVSLDDVLMICESINQTDDIQLSSFMVNGSNDPTIPINGNTLPYFASLKVTDITGTTPVEKSNTNIVQSFENLEIPLKEI